VSTDGPSGPPHSRQDVTARAAGLIAVAEDLAGEFSLRPLLARILRRCTELLGCHAGSICSVDEANGTYRKEADIGVACQSGQVFPLTEGMTGAVVARRAPVWFARYDEVHGGHVAAQERATLRWNGAGASSGSASSSAGTNDESSGLTTPSCLGCSPGTRRSR
jgi:hypothetical protein